MILYIIRHADPDYENNTITEFGWQEAHALADWLKDVPIDKIYTSPMGRAIDTAQPTCRIKGLESEILPWTGEDMDYMLSYQITPQSRCNYSYSIQKGVYGFEGAIYKVTRSNDQSIAVFCHGGFGGAWIAHLLGMAPGLAYPIISLGTSSVTKFVFRTAEEGYTRPQLRHLGEICHIYQAGLRVNNR